RRASRRGMGHGRRLGVGAARPSAQTRSRSYVPRSHVPGRARPRTPDRASADPENGRRSDRRRQAHVMGEQPYRSGFVSLIGRPNVGKSTLLNAFIGRKVAITSRRPQTTRNAIRGVLTGDAWQIVFIDTPGLHKPKTLLGERLNDVVHHTLREVDAIVFMLDATQPVGSGDEFVARAVLNTHTPAICVVNKMDAARNEQLVPQLQSAGELGDWKEIIPVSAARGTNVGRLQELLVEQLPEGPQYYPDGMVTDQPRDVLLAEIVREKALQLTRQEIPHSIAVKIGRASCRER